jgi:hypothetical protein
LKYTDPTGHVLLDKNEADRLRDQLETQIIPDLEDAIANSASINAGIAGILGTAACWLLGGGFFATLGSVDISA